MDAFVFFLDGFYVFDNVMSEYHLKHLRRNAEKYLSLFKGEEFPPLMLHTIMLYCEVQCCDDITEEKRDYLNQHIQGIDDKMMEQNRFINSMYRLHYGIL